MTPLFDTLNSSSKHLPCTGYVNSTKKTRVALSRIHYVKNNMKMNRFAGDFTDANTENSTGSQLPSLFLYRNKKLGSNPIAASLTTIESSQNRSIVKDSRLGALLVSFIKTLGNIASEVTAKQRSTCCYCGDKAAEAENGCNLSCKCDWHVAHLIWEKYSTGNDVLPDTYESDMLYVERMFGKALQDDERNPLLLADYALFLWRERSRLVEAEELLNTALSLETRDSSARQTLLNLYSTFLSFTPPSSMKTQLPDYRSTMGI
mmetsp:Transcript_24969/g.34414  ORF Transcript_24969/g.34414 Transcript_24969/m.34414 type:complete len:262 (+) Transcript_24969:84-869(+)